jgi:hypothetical protein
MASHPEKNSVLLSLCTSVTDDHPALGFRFRISLLTQGKALRGDPFRKVIKRVKAPILLRAKLHSAISVDRHRKKQLSIRRADVTRTEIAAN